MVINRRRNFLAVSFGFLVLFGCREDIYRLDRLVGKDESAVIGELGHPENKLSVRLDRNTRLKEYQSSLYEFFPNLDESGVEVMEYRWKKDGNSVVVWFIEKDGRWVAVDTLAWTDAVRF